MGTFLLRHRTFTRLIHPFFHDRIKPHRFAEKGCRVCRAVWSGLMDQPGIEASLEQGKADMEAGRWYRWHGNGVTTPNPDWPKDGPQPT